MPKRKLDPLPAAAFQILLSLADEDLHGYGIMRRVAEQTGNRLRLGPGTLYSSIQSLLEEKLIEEVGPPENENVESGANPDSQQGSKPASKAADERRRYYRLTGAGRKLARTEAERLADLLRVARAKNILRGDYV
jgi:Transcriptional regulator PadR-like family